MDLKWQTSETTESRSQRDSVAETRSGGGDANLSLCRSAEGGMTSGFLFWQRHSLLAESLACDSWAWKQRQRIQLHNLLMNVKGTISLFYIKMMNACFKSFIRTHLMRVYKSEMNRKQPVTRVRLCYKLPPTSTWPLQSARWRKQEKKKKSSAADEMRWFTLPGRTGRVGFTPPRP